MNPLIRLLVKKKKHSETNYYSRASDVEQVYAHFENGHTNTSIPHNASVTHLGIFCADATAVHRKELFNETPKFE